MITQALLLLAMQSQGDLASDLETALRGKPLSGPEFHRAIAPVVAKHHVTPNDFRRTVGDTRALLVDLRKGEHETWRLFVWPDGLNYSAQVIKKFTDAIDARQDSITQGTTYWRGDRLVIAGHEYNGRNNAPAGLTEYRFKGGRWQTTQHLVGSEGEAQFVGNRGSIDPDRLSFQTWGSPRFIPAAHVGPRVKYQETWLKQNGKYVIRRTAIDSPVAAIDRLAGFIAKNDRASFDRHVPASLRGKMWDGVKFRMNNIGRNEQLTDDVRSFEMDADGSTVTFEKQGDRWVPVKWTSA